MNERTIVSAGQEERIAHLEQAMRYQEITFATLLHMKDRYSDRFDRMMIDGLGEINHALAEFKQGIEQINQAIGEISEATEEISGSAQEQRNLAAGLSETIQGAELNARASHENLRNLDDRIIDLQKHSMDIGSLVRDLEEIAETLNILSINGAIQAARGGDIGKGFAIVTSEMRKLAGNVKLSAASQMGAIEKVVRLIADAANMSKSVRGITDTTRNSMKEGTDSVETLRNHLEAVAANCQELAATVRQFSSTIYEILRSIAGIEEMTRRISDTFGQITRFNQVVTGIAGECAGIADESASLREAAGRQMKRIVDRFEKREVEGMKPLALAQMFMVLPYGILPDPARQDLRREGTAPSPEDMVLSLLGAAGGIEGAGAGAIGSRAAGGREGGAADSRDTGGSAAGGYSAGFNPLGSDFIPLPAQEAESAGKPLIREVFRATSIPYEAIIHPRKGDIQKMGEFLFIEDVMESPLFQDRGALITGGIASLVTVGGLTLSGSVFLLFLWFRERIPVELAEALSVLGPSFQLNMRALADSERFW